METIFVMVKALKGAISGKLLLKHLPSSWKGAISETSIVNIGLPWIRYTQRKFIRDYEGTTYAKKNLNWKCNFWSNKF